MKEILYGLLGELLLIKWKLPCILAKITLYFSILLLL